MTRDKKQRTSMEGCVSVRIRCVRISSMFQDQLSKLFRTTKRCQVKWSFLVAGGNIKGWTKSTIYSE
jgi:hypothetical protein